MNSKPLTILLEATLPDRIQAYLIDKSEFIFGRGGKSDTIIQDQGISREHLRIKLEKNVLHIMDLNSLNGTFIDGYRINSHEYIAIQEKSVISFGKCAVTVTLKLQATAQSVSAPPPEESFEIVSMEQEKKPEAAPAAAVAVVIEAPAPAPAVVEAAATQIREKTSVATAVSPAPNPAAAPAKKSDAPEFNKLIDLSAFPKSEDDYRISFKNVGLDLPKYKNPGEHAKEIIKEAEYQKYAIIKSAEVFKSKTVNDTRILAKKASDESYNEFRKMVDHLLETTRLELKKLRTDTEILLDEKRLQANEEIQKLWDAHEDQVRHDKERQLSNFEKENKIKLDLSIEKTRSDMFAERHKILTDAETEILKKKRAFQVEFENEKSEHLARVKIYTEELVRTQTSIEDHKKVAKDSKVVRDDAELEMIKVMSQLKAEKENLQIITNSFKETQESHKIIEHELATFNETKHRALSEIDKTQAELSKLNNNFSLLSEKKQKLDEEIQSLTNFLKDAKTKAKAEVEKEYAILKDTENRKFDDFKANELKDLQKIRDAHSDSIKTFSVDLSQEIATKLELLATKNGYTKFDFEKHFELINSVIQIKSAVKTGSESKHAQQLEGWKNRKRKENFSLISRGFAAGLICVFIGNAVYNRLNIDPVKEELARISSENKKRDVENRYVPEKSDKYYDNYVETTLFTDRFTEVYHDKNNQREWVNYATKYFLRNWKVEEEKVIEVISNSNALVQNVNEMVPTMKKTKFKSDIAKMKDLEQEYIEKQAQILGTNVKYEAYKKIEKEFFQSKMQGRVPASQ